MLLAMYTFSVVKLVIYSSNLTQNKFYQTLINPADQYVILFAVGLKVEITMVLCKL